MLVSDNEPETAMRLSACAMPGVAGNGSWEELVLIVI